MLALLLFYFVTASLSCVQRPTLRSLMLSSTLFCFLLSVFFISGHLLIDDRTTRRPRKGDPEKGRVLNRQQRSVSSQSNDECQEGDPLGESYLGRMNVTTSGRTYQVWAAQQPHEHTTEYGEHNYCRNPDRFTFRNYGSEKYIFRKYTLEIYF